MTSSSPSTPVDTTCSGARGSASELGAVALGSLLILGIRRARQLLKGADRLEPRAQVELRGGAGETGGHRRGRDPQLVGDGFVGGPLRGVGEDLALAIAEPVEAGRGRLVAPRHHEAPTVVIEDVDQGPTAV